MAYIIKENKKIFSVRDLVIIDAPYFSISNYKKFYVDKLIAEPMRILNETC